jgi:hypothetical protein
MPTTPYQAVIKSAPVAADSILDTVNDFDDLQGAGIEIESTSLTKPCWFEILTFMMVSFLLSSNSFGAPFFCMVYSVRWLHFTGYEPGTGVL